MKNHLRLSGTNSHTHAKLIIRRAILCMGLNI